MERRLNRDAEPVTAAGRARERPSEQLPPEDPADASSPPAGDESDRSGFARGRTPRCPQCRYDLTGTLHAGGLRCPECGHALDPGLLQQTRERRFFNRMGILVVVLSTLGVLGTVGVLVLAPERALFVVPLFVFGAAWIPFVIVARATRDMVE